MMITSAAHKHSPQRCNEEDAESSRVSPGVSSKERVRCALTATSNRTSHVLPRKKTRGLLCHADRRVINVQLLVVLSGTPKIEPAVSCACTIVVYQRTSRKNARCLVVDQIAHNTCLSRDSIQLFSGDQISDLGKSGELLIKSPPAAPSAH